MKHSLIIFWLFCCLLPAMAQDNPDETLVFIQDNTVSAISLFGSGTTTLAETSPPNPPFGAMNPMISPDGEMVYFSVEGNVWRVPITGDSEPEMVSDLKLIPWLPITFSPDGTQLMIPVSTPDRMIELWVGDLDGANMQQLVSLPERIPCGTDGVTSDILAYWEQTGLFGNIPLLTWVSETQVLMNDNCFGWFISSVDLDTNEVAPLDEEMVRVKINPDKRMLAGFIETNNAHQTIRLFDFATGDQQDFTFDHHFDQLAWLPDGRLVVSAITSRAPIAFHPVDEQLALDLYIWFDDEYFGTDKPDTLPLHQTTLYIFDPATGDLTDLWTQEGFNGLPRMVAGNDNVFFSTINDFEELAIAFNEGQDQAMVEAAYPSSRIYVTNLDGDAPVLIVKGGKSPAFFDN